MKALASVVGQVLTPVSLIGTPAAVLKTRPEDSPRRRPGIRITKTKNLRVAQRFSGLRSAVSSSAAGTGGLGYSAHPIPEVFEELNAEGRSLTACGEAALRHTFS